MIPTTDGTGSQGQQFGSGSGRVMGQSPDPAFWPGFLFNVMKNCRQLQSVSFIMVVRYRGHWHVSHKTSSLNFCIKITQLCWYSEWYTTRARPTRLPGCTRPHVQNIGSVWVMGHWHHGSGRVSGHCHWTSSISDSNPYAHGTSTLQTDRKMDNLP